MNLNILLLIPVAIIFSIILSFIIGYLVGSASRLNSGEISIEEAIKTSSKKVCRDLRKCGYVLNYSVDSVKELDKFIKEYFSNGKLIKEIELFKNKDMEFFKLAMGAYIGEVIKKNYKGNWIYNVFSARVYDYINLEIELKNNITIYPYQETLKRINDTELGSLHSYLITLKEEL